MSSMESMHEAMIKRMGKFGLEKALSATIILESANRVLPPSYRGKVFKDGVITIEVPTSRDAYFFKQDLESTIEQINAALGKAEVTAIRIRVAYH